MLVLCSFRFNRIKPCLLSLHRLFIFTVFSIAFPITVQAVLDHLPVKESRVG